MVVILIIFKAGPAELMAAAATGHVVASTIFLHTEFAFWAWFHVMPTYITSKLAISDTFAGFTRMANSTTFEADFLAARASRGVISACAATFLAFYVV